MVCTKCGHEVPDGEEYCQFCGFDFDEENEEKIHNESKTVAIVAIVIFIAVIVLAVVVNAYNEKKQREKVIGALRESIEDTREIMEDFEKEAGEITKDIE